MGVLLKMKQQRIRRARSGFSMIELMAVLVIMGLLVTVVATTWRGEL